MLTVTAARAISRNVCRTSTTPQRRGMAGGFPANMAVKKNKYMEEWNGKREITEKTFEIKSNDVGTFLMYAVLIPYGIYTWSRSEFKSGNDRRYQDIF